MNERTPEPALDRFTGLAETYARCRPGYPPAVFDLLVKLAHLDGSSLAVDVGCGTGISTRLLADRGIPTIGIEPNHDMRAQAEAHLTPPGLPAPRYLDGQAESTGLPDASCDLVLSAQAFHWFDARAALEEFRRILRPDGWVALLWNERDESDPFTAAYGTVIRTAPGAVAVEGPRGSSGEVLLAAPGYVSAEKRTFANEQSLDEAGLLGRTFSMSYAPRELTAAETMARALRAVFARFHDRGRVVVRYVTTLYLARRPACEPAARLLS